MTYNPLHHKYRPQTFAQLVGQEAIATTLTNAIATERIAPAYLFTGPRGTGKTSSARILAKSLNCLASDRPTSTPCGRCEVCTSINKSSALDVIEIDAASNTGVDNIRDIIERSQFAPVQCRYKLYIVDEAHMLSSAAFNAFLKTLEEPPARVVFVLATTDPQRILPTIISRTQRFDFRRIPLESMVAHLKYIAQEENIEIVDQAIQLVAQVANGGLRDAESLLDQLSLLPTTITPQQVWDLVGAVPEQDLLSLIQAIHSNDPEATLRLCRHLMDRGKEPLIVLQNLASFYLNLLIAKTSPDSQDLVAVTHTTWKQLCQEVANWDLNTILQGQQHLKNSETQIKRSTQPRLWLEVTLLGLLPSAIAIEEQKVDIKTVVANPIKISQPEALLSTQKQTVSSPAKSKPEPQKVSSESQTKTVSSQTESKSQPQKVSSESQTKTVSSPLESKDSQPEEIIEHNNILAEVENKKQRRDTTPNAGEKEPSSREETGKNESELTKKVSEKNISQESNQQIADRDKRVISSIYTDGSCIGNPGAGGWAMVVYFADGSTHEKGGAAADTTNNRMEIQGAIAALQYLADSGQTSPITLYTDSEYVINGITKWIVGWKKRDWRTTEKKPVVNQDLWQILDQLNSDLVSWEHVRGHSGNVGNERCDEIAKAFAYRQQPRLNDPSLPPPKTFSTSKKTTPEQTPGLESQPALTTLPPEPAATTNLSETAASTVNQIPPELMWKKVVGVMPKMTKALVGEHCLLLSFDGSMALIGVKSKGLFKVAQNKKDSIEKAFNQVWHQKVSVSLQLGTSPPPQQIIVNPIAPLPTPVEEEVQQKNIANIAEVGNKEQETDTSEEDLPEKSSKKYVDNSFEVEQKITEKSVIAPEVNHQDNEIVQEKYLTTNLSETTLETRKEDSESLEKEQKKHPREITNELTKKEIIQESDQPISVDKVEQNIQINYPLSTEEISIKNIDIAPSNTENVPEEETIPTTESDKQIQQEIISAAENLAAFFHGKVITLSNEIDYGEPIRQILPAQESLEQVVESQLPSPHPQEEEDMPF